jgi:hypothetical protein
LIVANALALSAADEVDDFDLVAFANFGGSECRALQDDQIVFDRDPARIDVELGEERRDGPWTVDLE